MVTVFIGIGSNLGDRLANVNEAIDYLRALENTEVEAVSSIIETEAIGASGPQYLNGVVKIRTTLSPKDLLRQLQTIEKALGRVRAYKNAPRTIDLDILLYGNLVMAGPDLVIPHPHMDERDFVIKPLLEIDPAVEGVLKRLRHESTVKDSKIG
jgi:2-amino-4-hydroxy-6-hydroxymethyldihydropteridine diphosphokinase